MTFLGIDFGTKRIGLALSDANGTLAFPKEVIKNDSQALGRLAEIIEQENVTEIVVGDSLDQAGQPNKIGSEVQQFIGQLTLKFFLPVHKEKEFFSSVEAHGRMGKEVNNARLEKFTKTADLDAKAAAIILQRFLDRKHK